MTPERLKSISGSVGIGLGVVGWIGVLVAIFSLPASPWAATLLGLYLAASIAIVVEILKSELSK